MDKYQFEKLIKPLVAIYDEIELEIIQNILKKLKNYTSISGSIEWYLEKLNDLGVLNSDTKKIIKAHKIDADKIINELSNKTVSSMDDFDRLKQYYEHGLIDTNPIDLFNSVSMNNLMNNATKDVFDIMKLIDSKVLEGTDEAYKKILNKAYIETASGIYTYQESIRNALKDFAKEGIRTVHYDNGRTLSIEAVVRRDVITRVNKLVGDIELQNANELGTNLVYVDQHEGARIRTPYIKYDYEAHAEWQGKVYMIEGSSKEYDNFYEKTGYGEMLGLKGLNCYHDFRPFFEWESIPERIDEEKNREKRELLDKQRTFERKIRQLRREKEVYKQIDKEEYKSTCNQLKLTNNKYNKFLENNNLNRDYSRDYVSNENVNIAPQFIGDKGYKKYTFEEVQVLGNNIKLLTDKYIDIPSKWSGKIIINDSSFPNKAWNCNIETRSITSPSTILHEMLHSKSISYYNAKEYISNPGFEEIPIHLLTQEISLKEGFELISSKYDDMCNDLRHINNKHKICQNDYLFAKELFKVPFNQRERWLFSKINSDQESIEILKNIKYNKLWEDLWK